VKIVDANVLIHAVNQGSPAHGQARRWLDEALSGREPLGLPWVVLLAFIRLTTSNRVFTRPLLVSDAMGIVEIWLGRPVTLEPTPTKRHTGILRGLLKGAGSAGNLTTDAHLAALAIEHGATVVSFDRDFQRFGVPIEVPS